MQGIGVRCWMYAAVAAGAVYAQHGSTTTVNPNTGPMHAAEGAVLYKSQCAGCHGPEGAGTGAGPALNKGSFQRGGSDEALFQTISKGIPGTSMPAFPKNSLHTWQLITYIRGLSMAGRMGKSTGDARAGARIFQKHCHGCHTVGNEGGFTGPDLTAIGSQRSLVELQRSIREPDETVPSGYWSVVVQTNGGKELRGVRLNEDTHSVQLRDDSGRLVSVLKRNVTGMELVQRSPMPSFAGKLSEKEIDDVLAYLTTQEGSRP